MSAPTIAKALKGKKTNVEEMAMHKDMKLIYIEWEDAFTQGDGWKSSQELDEWADEIFNVRQSGFVYNETDKHIIMVGGYNPGVGEGEFETYKQCIKIPKSWTSVQINLTNYVKLCIGLDDKQRLHLDNILANVVERMKKE